MIKAVIFDMYETLITHYAAPLYFGAEMAEDAGVPKEKFFRLWRDSSIEHNRTIGKMTLEELLEQILKENDCYNEALLNKLVAKRIATKEVCFNHLHGEILPLLTQLQNQGLLIGLISNCYEEEAKVIRKRELFSFFNKAYLSCEQGVAKPDKEIFVRCMQGLSVKPEECLYVGDGGSDELEAARALGMKTVQATWYLQEGSTQPSKWKEGFVQAESPLEILHYLE